MKVPQSPYQRLRSRPIQPAIGNRGSRSDEAKDVRKKEVVASSSSSRTRKDPPTVLAPTISRLRFEMSSDFEELDLSPWQPEANQYS
jgi:hypothetical protein